MLTVVVFWLITYQEDIKLCNISVHTRNTRSFNDEF